MRERVYLYDAIASNRRRIALGVFVFFTVILLESLAVAAIVTRGQVFAWKPFLLSSAVALGVTLVLFPLLACWAYFKGKQAILRLFLTAPLSEQDERKLRHALVNVCIAAGAEEPDILVIANNGVNAISLARGYQEGLILVSRGAVENLNRDELEALFAHEVYHIMSHDTWIWMLGLGVSAFLPLAFSAYWSGAGKLVDVEERPVFTNLFLREFGLHFLVVCVSFVIVWVILAVFWIPLWAAYFAFVLPGNRDFLADSQALLITRNPEAVVSALKKSDIMRSDPIRGDNVFVNHMFFNQPLKPPGSITGWLIQHLHTHPCIENRLECIASMT